MLSSRWKKIRIYTVSSVDGDDVTKIIATNKKQASEAFESVTGKKPYMICQSYRLQHVLVTEEAQAQSELFPNQVRK